MLRVTAYPNGETHYLNPERIQQMQDVYGREWRTSIAMIDAPHGDRWLRVRESAKEIQEQLVADRALEETLAASERLLRQAVIRAEAAEAEVERLTAALEQIANGVWTAQNSDETIKWIAREAVKKAKAALATEG